MAGVVQLPHKIKNGCCEINSRFSWLTIQKMMLDAVARFIL